MNDGDIGLEDSQTLVSLESHLWKEDFIETRLKDFNVFFKYDATYPFYSDAIWFLTQMRRWGQIPEAKPEEWYHETAKKVYRPDIWKQAADMLIKEGYLTASDVPETDGYKPATSDFIDGNTFDGKDPISYINSFKIGNKD